MTRIDVALNILRKQKLESLEPWQIIAEHCPGEFIYGAPVSDSETLRILRVGQSLGKSGCKGMLCRECWERKWFNDTNRNIV